MSNLSCGGHTGDRHFCGGRSTEADSVSPTKTRLMSLWKMGQIKSITPINIYCETLFHYHRLVNALGAWMHCPSKVPVLFLKGIALIRKTDAFWKHTGYKVLSHCCPLLISLTLPIYQSAEQQKFTKNHQLSSLIRSLYFIESENLQLALENFISVSERIIADSFSS